MLTSPTLSPTTRDALARTVQRNCDIADARYEMSYTLCIYLLKMREYFRWEQGHGVTDALSKQAVGDWLEAKEALWQGLDAEEFVPLEWHGRVWDPFDSEAINQALAPYGLVYSGGLGSQGKPHFFLAEALQRESVGAFQIHITGHEYARDLAAPPGLNLGRQVFIRREALRASLWERVESWRWSHADNAMGRCIRTYGFARGSEPALEAMTDDHVAIVLAHEIGEAQAHELLGEDWNRLLVSLPRSRGELMARSVRDHLADALSTLPDLLDDPRPERVHGYFSTLSTLRRELFPRLDAAYQAWLIDSDVEHLRRLVDPSRAYWLGLARELVDLYRRHGEDAAGHIQRRLDQARL